MVFRETLIMKAEKAVLAGNLASGIATYRELLALDPQDPAVLNRLGDLLARSGQTHEAIEIFFNLAADYATKGLPVKAVAVYKKIIKLDPAQLSTYEILADLYARMGLRTEARTQYQVLANYYAKHNDTVNAARMLDAVAKVDERGQPPKPAEASATTELSITGIAPVRSLADLVIFLCHASEDKPAVRDLYSRLKRDSLQPWLDEEDLLPGQRWELEIKKAVRRSHVVVICLSNRSTTKSGFVHKEIRFALDILDEQPEGVIFVVPARLEECVVPEPLTPLHYVDLYKDGGYDKLVRAVFARARQLGFTVAAST